MSEHHLVNRLLGKYPCGPLDSKGVPEFGFRDFGTPSLIHREAAEALRRRDAALLEIAMNVSYKVMEDLSGTTHAELVRVCKEHQDEDSDNRQQDSGHGEGFRGQSDAPGG